MAIINILGWIFAVILAIVAALSVFVGFHSVPDIKRYFKLRHM